MTHRRPRSPKPASHAMARQSAREPNTLAMVRFFVVIVSPEVAVRIAMAGSRLNSGPVAQTEGPTRKEVRLKKVVLKPLSILGNGELNTLDAARKRDP
jgi:hypothetical protein